MKTNAQKLQPLVGSVLGYGWETMKKYFLRMFLVVLILGIANIPLSILDAAGDSDTALVFLQIFGLAYLLFIMVPLRYGAAYLFLKNVRNMGFEIRELFDAFYNYMNVVLAGLLYGAIIGIGIFLLVVPGIIFACRLAFVPYLVMDKKLDPVKAVEESWRLTKGYGWRIFGLGIVSFFIIIAGLIVMFVGVLVSLMWTKAAFAAMYQAVIEERGEYVEVPENPNGD